MNLSRTVRLVVTFLVLTLQSSSYVLAENYESSVLVKVRNASQQHVFHCQLILAHFVTEDVQDVPPGAEVQIRLVREINDGTLYRVNDFSPMAVERILCGVQGRWGETQRELRIALLRQGGTATLEFDCGESGSTQCEAK